MKIVNLILPFIMMAGCQTAVKEELQPGKKYSFFVGTYTQGESEGIYKYALTRNGNMEKTGLMARSENPSFLALSKDRQFLVAINETDKEGGAGTVESYKISSDSLLFLSRRSSGGGHPCFVATHESGLVLAANYTGGNVGLLKLDKKGALSDLLDVQQHSGKGTTDRQENPHAHSAWFVPNDSLIISVDLGTNELWFSHVDPEKLKFVSFRQPKLGMAPGAGPRHLAFHPHGKFIYVVNELDCTISLLYKKDDGSYERDTSYSTLPAQYEGINTCADIHITSDGKFLYASNRGHNSLAIYEVNSYNGSLNLLGHQNTFGKDPRNFSISPDEKYLLVANQHSNNIVSFQRDKRTGRLKYAYQIKAPTPVCILFLSAK